MMNSVKYFSFLLTYFRVINIIRLEHFRRYTVELNHINLSQEAEEIDTTTRDRNSIIKIRNGDSKELDSLIQRYQNFVYHKSTPYFLAGAEKEDIVQEGMIGLYKAIKSFDLEKDITFKYFADLCIKRQIITAIKTYSRQKHTPLNSYLSLNKTANDEEDDREVIEKLDMEVIPDPLEKITIKETYKKIEDKMSKLLSPFEQQVYYSYLSGYSYSQIAKNLRSHPKAVDNAIQRIKKKIDKHILNDEDMKL